MVFVYLTTKILIMNYWFTAAYMIILCILGQTSFKALAEGSYKEIWPQWRGPERNGQHIGKEWPESLNESNLKMIWSKGLGKSYSSPVVDLDTIYTTESVDGKTEKVVAFKRETGEEIWSASWPGGMKVPFFARSNGSWIRSTPAIHKNKLFVLGMQEKLVCLDKNTGRIIWDLDFPKKLSTPEPSFGGVCSPIVVGDDLYIQAGGGVVKVNTDDGTIKWTSETSKDAMGSSPFSSPMVHEIQGQRQLVALGRNSLTGINLETGKLLWSQNVPAFRGMNILTPTFTKNGILTATYGGKTHLFQLSKIDTEKWSVKESWQQKFQGYMSSPVLVEEHAYIHGRSGRLVCIDTTSGEIEWTSDKSFGKYCSVITNGENLLVLSSKGELFLIPASPEEFRITDSLEVTKDDTWAHIGIADNQVFIRSLKSLKIFSWEDKPADGIKSSSSNDTTAISVAQAE